MRLLLLGPPRKRGREEWATPPLQATLAPVLARESGAVSPNSLAPPALDARAAPYCFGPQLHPKRPGTSDSTSNSPYVPTFLLGARHKVAGSTWPSVGPSIAPSCVYVWVCESFLQASSRAEAPERTGCVPHSSCTCAGYVCTRQKRTRRSDAFLPSHRPPCILAYFVYLFFKLIREEERCE